MKKAFEAVINYLKDWKNLLAHAIVGVLILAVGLFLPVPPIYRIAICCWSSRSIFCGCA